MSAAIGLTGSAIDRPQHLGLAGDTPATTANQRVEPSSVVSASDRDFARSALGMRCVPASLFNCNRLSKLDRLLRKCQSGSDCQSAKARACKWGGELCEQHNVLECSLGVAERRPL